MGDAEAQFDLATRYANYMAISSLELCLFKLNLHCKWEG